MDKLLSNDHIVRLKIKINFWKLLKILQLVIRYHIKKIIKIKECWKFWRKNFDRNWENLFQSKTNGEETEELILNKI
jgi:hypothetical protein